MTDTESDEHFICTLFPKFDFDVADFWMKSDKGISYVTNVRGGAHAVAAFKILTQNNQKLFNDSDRRIILLTEFKKAFFSEFRKYVGRCGENVVRQEVIHAKYIIDQKTLTRSTESTLQKQQRSFANNDATSMWEIHPPGYESPQMIIGVVGLSLLICFLYTKFCM